MAELLLLCAELVVLVLMLVWTTCALELSHCPRERLSWMELVLLFWLMEAVQAGATMAPVKERVPLWAKEAEERMEPMVRVMAAMASLVFMAWFLGEVGLGRFDLFDLTCLG